MGSDIASAGGTRNVFLGNAGGNAQTLRACPGFKRMACDRQNKYDSYLQNAEQTGFKFSFVVEFNHI